MDQGISTEPSTETRKLSITELVARLVELTSERKLVWRSLNPKAVYPDEGTDERVEGVFEARFNGRLMRFVRRSEKVIHYTGLSSLYLSKGSQSYHWKTSHELHLVDDSGTALWTFGYASAYDDLDKAVSRQLARVDEFVQAVFAA